MSLLKRILFLFENMLFLFVLIGLAFISVHAYSQSNVNDNEYMMFSLKDGMRCAVKIDNVDSLRFVPRDSLNSEWINLKTDTIHYADTVYHIDSLYYIDSVYYVSEIIEPNSPTYMHVNLLLKDTLRVLDIGNSFTDDATAHLYDIVKASGADVRTMCLYKLFRPSGSFKTWVDAYNGKDNTSYSYSKVFGGLTVNASGSGGAYHSELLRDVLKKQWDLIVIHPLSTYSDNFDVWGSWSTAGGLDSLLSILRVCQPDAHLGFLLTHSSYNNSKSAKQSTAQRWQKIMESTKKMKERYDVSFVVPYGTAVENLRLTKLNNSKFLTRDGHHLEEGLTRYAAACAYYQALVAPRSGISILGNSYRRKMSNTNCLDITDETAPIAQMAAFLATAFWWKNLNPEDYLDK